MILGSGAEDDYNPAQPHNFEKMLLRRRNFKKEIETTIIRER